MINALSFQTEIQKQLSKLAGLLPFSTFTDEQWEWGFDMHQTSKSEFHGHAEAYVLPRFYETKNQEQKRFESHEIPHTKAPFLNFNDFIKSWCDNLMYYEGPDFYFDLAQGCMERMVRDKITYCELHFSPFDSLALRGLTLSKDSQYLDELRKIINSFLRGLQCAQTSQPGYACKAILDPVSVRPQTEMETLFDLLQEITSDLSLRHQDGSAILVGLGMGGPELPEKIPTQVSIYHKMRKELGLGLDIHTGEQNHVSPQLHREVIELMKPDRVSHGIKGFSENYFFNGPIAVNPLSNLITGCWKDQLKEHPVSKMKDLGVRFSVNSDDPLLFNTCLTLEYMCLHRVFGWEKSVFLDNQMPLSPWND
jgi:adenosine deaminase